jgi:hypothetical protein
VDGPDKKEHPGPPGWRLGAGLTTPTRGKKIYVQKTSEMLRMKYEASYEGGQSPERAVAPYMDGIMN